MCLLHQGLCLEKVLLDFRQEGVAVTHLVIDSRDFGRTWLRQHV
jgi:hypothetical protein